MTWAQKATRLAGRLSGLLVFAAAAAPGLCAIACDLDLCPGCGVEQAEPSCCKDKAAKQKSCCETMAKVTASDDLKARHSNSFALDIPILPAFVVLPTVDAPAIAASPVAENHERAPPAPDVGVRSPRGPPDSCV